MTDPGTGARPISWAELARRSLARQFPAADSVPELVRRIGPIQAQAARAPFLGIAARMAAADHAAITTAYEDLELVRGSSIRGTVHTCAAEQHPILDVLTRLGIGSRWVQYIAFSRAVPEQLWAALDEYASPAWRTPDELRAFMRHWLLDHDSPEAAAAVDNTVGRHLAFAHGSMVRRPLKGGWEGQGAPGYRTATALLGDRSEWYADPDRAVREAVRLHLRSHGPASRYDIAWWAGIGLQRVDRALADLVAELVPYAGPDDRIYHDLSGGTPEPQHVPGLLLLPEFDALFCAYDPKARTRFVDPEHHRTMWSAANGLLRPPLLLDGRITGYWRLEGSGRTRRLVAYWFAGTRRPRLDDVRQAADSITRALPVRLSDVQVTPHLD